MGANYDMMIVQATSQKKVIQAINRFLKSRGLVVVRQATVPEAARKLSLRSHTDNVVFVGPERFAPWIPLACVGENMKISGKDWFSRNPLAVSVSERLSPVLLMWSLDSGFVSGYSLFENGDLAESEVAFCSSARRRKFLYPGVPTPTRINSERLKTFLGDKHFGYQKFTSHFGSLEEATGNLASRFGLDVHLIDASSLAEGESAIALTGGEYRDVDPVDWIALDYEQSSPSREPPPYL